MKFKPIFRKKYNFFKPNKYGDVYPMYVVVENRPAKMINHVHVWVVPDIAEQCFFDWEEAVDFSRTLNNSTSSDHVFIPMDWHDVSYLFPTHVRESLFSMLSLHFVGST